MNKLFGFFISFSTAIVVLLGVVSLTVYEPQGDAAPFVAQAADNISPTATSTDIPRPTQTRTPFVPPPVFVDSSVWLPFITSGQEKVIQAIPIAIEPTATLRPGTSIKAKISWYNPALGGPNCFSFVNGECVSRMASGRNWKNYIDKAVACPPEFPFGTEFDILGKTYTCWDRGGKIQRLGPNLIWLDILTKKAIVPYGTKVTVYYRLPSK